MAHGGFASPAALLSCMSRDVSHLLIACDAHIVARTCSFRKEPAHEGGESLSSPTDRAEAGCVQVVGKPVVPDLGQAFSRIRSRLRPRSTPVLLSLAICAVRHYWARKGRRFIKGFLESKGVSNVELQTEEVTLEAMRESVLDGIVDHILKASSQHGGERESTGLPHMVTQLSQSWLFRITR